MSDRELIQMFSLVLAAVLIWIEAVRIRQNRDNVFWVFPLLIWGLLTFIYYSVLAYDRHVGIEQYIDFGAISAVLRMIGLIAVITTEGGRWLWARRNTILRQSNGH